MTMRRKSLLRDMVVPESCLKSTDGYDARSIPSSGYYLKDEDSKAVQLSLFENK